MHNSKAQTPLFTFRNWITRWLRALCLLMVGGAWLTVSSLAQSEAAEKSPLAASSAVRQGAGASESASGPVATAPVPAPVRRWLSAPRVYGHLGAKDLGLVINDDDPYSVQVGAYYARARHLRDKQVLHVRLPVKGVLSAQEFDALDRKINDFFGPKTQALALAWRVPYAVECNAITGALAMGFDPKLCSNTCAPSRRSSYFGSISTRPYGDFHMRLSMLLAAGDIDEAKGMIDRGVQSDGTLGLRGALPVDVHFVTTSDAIRSQRQLLFPPAGPVPKFGLDVILDQTDAVRHADRVLMYLTGRASVEGLETVNFVPGALADHLTSFGGILDKPTGQMNVLAWIDAGATATYGTVSEPCAHLQKFPNPQALLLFYIQGATALEAYWKSVMWPQQGLFVGEPLAAPFARR